MNKKIAKLLALGMSIALVFSLAACGDTTETPDEPETTTEEVITTEAPAVPATGESESASESVSGEQPTQAPGETQAAGIQVPTDTAGVLSLYNSAVANCGFTTANVQLTWGSSDTTIGELNSSTGGKVQPEFEKPYTKSATPSSINSSDVSSASAKDNGATIELTINLNPQTEIKASGTKYGDYGYPYFITYEDADELVQRCGKAAAGISISISEGSAKLNLYDGVVTATIDKASGKMTALSCSLGERVMGKAMGFVNAEIWGTGVITFS
ncbi:MAG: hypothetical protein ACLU8W_00560 [Clostridia bacterium]